MKTNMAQVELNSATNTTPTNVCVGHPKTGVFTKKYGYCPFTNPLVYVMKKNARGIIALIAMDFFDDLPSEHNRKVTR